ncbi:folate-binding protein YgfZ [Moraxella sp. ZY210820]|uniref:CAF17-like 4Fe-4S cluster assembly/insertion protein YgfZ n=1 Tax=unclassified Moraxella TaxID=2685852 RepID=UPI00272F1407|nr:folate-binding Fe/S cluster repair protein [Moraxella sp. ZY210820]WLF83883.1 folate-binding Fe/S cluster repair protein [Moraxella sp. ZY210820]
MNELKFSHFYYTGRDAEKFLQGQLTVNAGKLDAEHYQATAICDLKGRVQFGLWIKRLDTEQFSIIIAQDLAEMFQQHIKKFGAFSKAELTIASDIYPSIEHGLANFSTDIEQKVADELWQSTAIQQGQAWINHTTSHLFQPQELRLHQRGGVDYDKGCYLGQEIVARLWFRAQPKHWLHLIAGHGDCPQPAAQLNKDVQVVNSVINADNQWLALVVAKPEALATLDVKILDLPEALNGEIGRPK